MKNVNYVIVHPELGVWNEENNSRVRDESRSLGYFLGLKLKSEKIKSDQFSGIFIIGTNMPNEIYYINNLIVIEVIFKEQDYPKKGLIKEINEYLILRLEDGLLRIQEQYPEIVEVLKQGIKEFRHENYHCRWIHKKKKFGKYTVQLRCEMDINTFNLHFDIINKNKEILWSKMILETPPNEYSFKYKFKDIRVVDACTIQVTDLVDSVWFEWNDNLDENKV